MGHLLSDVPLQGTSRRCCVMHIVDLEGEISRDCKRVSDLFIGTGVVGTCIGPMAEFESFGRDSSDATSVLAVLDLLFKNAAQRSFCPVGRGIAQLIQPMGIERDRCGNGCREVPCRTVD